MTGDDGTTASPGNHPHPPLTTDRQHRDSAVVVRFTGEIDINGADTVNEALAAALTEVTPPHPLVVDLTDVAFCDSTGLAALAFAHQRAINHHTPLRVVARSRPVLRSLQISGLDTLLDLHPDLTSALSPPHDPDQKRR